MSKTIAIVSKSINYCVSQKKVITKKPPINCVPDCVPCEKVIIMVFSD